MAVVSLVTMPLNAKQFVGIVAGKGFKVPPGGWNAENFGVHGLRLLMTLTRTSKIVRGKAAGPLAREAKKIIEAQMISIANFVLRGGKSILELSFPQNEGLWQRALDEEMRSAGIDVSVNLSPMIQSVMAQGYSKTSLLLGEEADPSRSGIITAESRQIATRITRINETTRKDVVRIVRQGIANGDTTGQVAHALIERAPKLAASRAVTIARTELNNAWTRGAAESFQSSDIVTHVSVIGCQAREENSPQYKGESTCNIQDVPVADADRLEFHINHTGTMVPSRFREADGSVTLDRNRPSILNEPPVGGE